MSPKDIGRVGEENACVTARVLLMGVPGFDGAAEMMGATG